AGDVPDAPAGGGGGEAGRPRSVRAPVEDGGPRNGPPCPPALVAPRVNRGGLMNVGGPRNGPPRPPAFVAPRMNRGGLMNVGGPARGPPPPPPPPRPRE